MEQNRKYLKNPVHLAIGFSLLTILLFEFGAYRYPQINREELYMFLLVTNIAMYFGFVMGTKLKIQQIPSTAPRFPVEKLIRFLFWVALLTCIPKFALFTGNHSLSISQIINSASKFLEESSEIYAARQELASATGIWRYINYGVVLAGPFYWAYTPLAMLFWGKLKTWRKVATLFIWMMYLLQYICTGTNVGFFDFFITLIVIVAIKRYVFNNTPQRSTSRKKKRMTMLLLIVLVMFLLLYLFDMIIGNRIGKAYLQNVRIGGLAAHYNPDSPLNKFLPDSLKPVAAYLTRYVAQPYNALAMSFDVSFESTFGVGHSWFLLDNVGGLLGDLWSRTYNVKLENIYDYGYYSNWHTAYLWFANDFSHYGVPVVLFVLFALFGKAWKDFCLNRNLYAFLMFMLFVKMTYFISANNQVFMHSDTLFAFWLLIALMIFSKKYVWEDAKHAI